MKQPSNHLSDRQIEEYVRDGYGSELVNQQAIAVESHIEDCDRCRERLLASSRQDLRMFLEVPLQEEVDHQRAQDCYDEETLKKFASGLLPDQNFELTSHISRCDYCSQEVKSYLKAPDPLPKPGPWSFFKQMLRRLPQLVPAMVFVPAGIAAFVIGTWVTAPRLIITLKMFQAQKAIEAAYGSRRPSEMRMTWSPYIPYRPDLGSDQDVWNNPKLDAAISSVAQEGDSPDPRWIRMRGRVELLRKRDEAIDVLTKAKNVGLDDPATQIDLAAAYFQKFIHSSLQQQSTAAGKSSDHVDPLLQHTLNLLNSVLQNPHTTREQQAVAFFDLAITYEKLGGWDKATKKWVGKWDDAVKTWDDYLKIDSTSLWADEARQHQNGDKQNIQPARQQGYREPVFFCPTPPILRSGPA